MAVHERQAVQQHEPREPRRELPGYEPLVGLQTRLLIGGQTLLPNAILPEFTRDVFRPFEDRREAYGVFEHASVGERRAHWQGKEGDVFDQQKAAWIRNTTSLFQDQQTQRFFQTEQGRNWSQVLGKLGVTTEGFTNQTAEQLYSTYFQVRPGEETGMRKFVKTALDAHRNQEGIVHYEQLRQDLPAIKWLANIFGTNSSDIVSQLVDAEAKLETNPETIVEDANREEHVHNQMVRRVNNLAPRERELLIFLAPYVQQAQQPQRQREHEDQAHRQGAQPTDEQTQNTDPWSAVPRPDQPVKIADAEVIPPPVPGGRIGETRRPERHLYWGTRDYPLVQEFIWQDGRHEMVRTVNPERPYHIPVELYFDADITPEQKQLIQTTAREVLAEIGVPNNLIIESPRSAAEFFSLTPPNQNRPNQTDEQMVLQAVRSDPEQIEKPHHAMVFTNKDLYSGNLHFVVGSAQPDLGTVISLQRIWNGIADPELRNQTIQTEIAHEIGHVYALPTARRGQANIDYETVPGAGGHCKSEGCSMKQGNAVPADFVRITQDRMNNLGDHFFCNECHIDLESKFHPRGEDITNNELEDAA